MSDQTITLVFIGTAAPEMAARASAYEDDVLPLLADHGAEVVFRGRRRVDQDPALPVEVHVLRFPDQAGLDGYLADPRRLELLDRHGDVFTTKQLIAVDPVT
jgi:hypothetical protein